MVLMKESLPDRPGSPNEAKSMRGDGLVSIRITTSKKKGSFTKNGSKKAINERVTPSKDPQASHTVKLRLGRSHWKEVFLKGWRKKMRKTTFVSNGAGPLVVQPWSMR